MVSRNIWVFVIWMALTITLILLFVDAIFITRQTFFNLAVYLLIYFIVMKSTESVTQFYIFIVPVVLILIKYVILFYAGGESSESVYGVKIWDRSSITVMGFVIEYLRFFVPGLMYFGISKVMKAS